MISFPKKYVPEILSDKDREQQIKMLKKSKKAYKNKKYITRKKVKTYKSKESKHIVNARKIYDIDKVFPNKNLSNKTGCSINSLEKIVKKGQGAYYSSGSRPNQTGHSWGIARLASAITGGKAAAVDFNILDEGCKKNSKALKLANESRKKHGHGTRKVPKIKIDLKKTIKMRGGLKDTNDTNDKKYFREMKETIVNLEEGPNNKKYTAHIINKKNKKERVLHFGDKNYEQFKDRTNIGLYTKKNHCDKNRQKNYYRRHSGFENRDTAIKHEIKKYNGYYTPKILSHLFLW